MTTTFPQLKLKTLVNFPTAAVGRNGITVDSAGTSYFIDIDYSKFNTAGAFPPGAYTLTYNPVTGVYLLAVPAGSSPSDLIPLADALSGGPGVSALYSRADHVHPAVAVVTPPPATSISDTPPVSPVAGQLWWESDTGILYIYYTDANSSQWVAIAWGGDPQLFANVPQNAQSTNYTTVLTDAQKHIFHPSADTTARTWTIAANASVAYVIGTAITFVNQNAAGVITIAITSDTLRLAGSGATGSRSLAANGVATALKIAATEWLISGTGLT